MGAQGGTDQVSDALQVEDAHVRVKTVFVGRGQQQGAKGFTVPQGQQGEGFQAGRQFAEPLVALYGRVVSAARGFYMDDGFFLDLRHGLEGRMLQGAAPDPPEAQGDMGNSKMMQHLVLDGVENALQGALNQQSHGQLVNLAADVVIGFGIADQFGQALFQRAVLVAQGQQLAFAQGNGMGAVRVWNLDFIQDGSVQHEKFRVVLEPGGNDFSVQHG